MRKIAVFIGLILLLSLVLPALLSACQTPVIHYEEEPVPEEEPWPKEEPLPDIDKEPTPGGPKTFLIDPTEIIGPTNTVRLAIFKKLLNREIEGLAKISYFYNPVLNSVHYKVHYASLGELSRAGVNLNELMEKVSMQLFSYTKKYAAPEIGYISVMSKLSLYGVNPHEEIATPSKIEELQKNPPEKWREGLGIARSLGYARQGTLVELAREQELRGREQALAARIKELEAKIKELQEELEQREKIQSQQNPLRD